MKQLIYITIFLIFASCNNIPIYEYWENGKPKEARIYPDNSDTTTYELLLYNQKGNIVTKGFIEKGIKVGHWTNFNENQSIKSEGLYNKTKIEDWNYYNFKGELVLKEYYNDMGFLVATGQMQGDKKNGKWQYFNENGNLKAQGFYKEDKVDSVWTSFYENGQMKAKGIFKEQISDYSFIEFIWKIDNSSFDENLSIMESRWYFWYESGENKAEIYYLNGDKFIVNWWDSEGNKIVNEGNGVLENNIKIKNGIIIEKGAA